MSDRGCFGLPSVYNAGAGACQRCSARPECAGKSYAVLHRIRGRVNVEQRINDLRLEFAGIDQAQRAELSLAQVTVVAGMPTKVQARLRGMLLAGFDQVARQSISHGENPFPASGSKHLHLAGQMLLDGTLTKKDYRAQCMARFGWSYGTASTETSVALALLRGLGLTREDGGAVRAAA